MFLLQDKGKGHSDGHGVDDALRFFTSLEKRAAFDLITKSSDKTFTDSAANTTKMRRLSQESHPKLHFLR